MQFRACLLMHWPLHLLLLLLLQVCWGAEGGTCAQADIIAALDKAVADGVDVINLSLGSSPYEFPDLMATALMQVARGGAFVAAAAGNDGPNQGSVENAAPWITTVAASSHNRAFRATVVLSRSTPGGNLLTLVGSGFYDGSLVVTPVILAEKAARADANLALAQQCYLGTLDAAKVRGKIVVSAEFLGRLSVLAPCVVRLFAQV
jgi:subtilisin family serine protease